jgi:small subunit ribosomal protein S17
MSDENKETTEETQDEAQQDTGPVSDESSAPDGADDSSSPPASEAPEADAADAPAPEEASEPNPEDELPWKERRRLAKSRRPSGKALPSDAEERKTQRAEARKRKSTLRRKQRAAAKTAHTPGTGTPPAERESNAAKVRQGIVVSSKGDKSITVRIDTARRHRTYEKIVRSSTKLHAHDERNEAGEGDMVRVIETRPLSKTKRWRLVDVVEKAR